MKDLRPEAAEALGAFLLVLVGCGAIMVDATTGALGHAGVAAAFGLVILVLVYALGHVSGAHFNPAITLGLAATGHFPWRRVAPYVAAQLLGATLAALTLRLVLGAVANLGATTPSAGTGPAAAFAVEALATFLLALVIVGVATDPRAPRAAAGLAIGATVALDALVFGPLTGASMNPARTLGPALVASTYDGLWLYLAAPVAGALAAAFAYAWLRAQPAPAAAAVPAPAPVPADAPEAAE